MSTPDLSAILSSLSDDDIANLSRAADEIFGSSQAQENEQKQEPSQDDFFGGLDPAVLAKLMQLLPLLKSGGENEKTRLICALKPLLSPPRRKKADEAIEMMRLMEILPLLFS